MSRIVSGIQHKVLTESHRFCHQDEDHDPSVDFEEYMACAVCGDNCKLKISFMIIEEGRQALLIYDDHLPTYLNHTNQYLPTQPTGNVPETPTPLAPMTVSKLI